MSANAAGAATVTRDSVNQAARNAAFQAAGRIPVEAAPLVAYRSSGRLLIIGEADQALTLSADLRPRGLECHVLARGEGVAPATGNVPMLLFNHRRDIRLTDHVKAIS